MEIEFYPRALKSIAVGPFASKRLRNITGRIEVIDGLEPIVDLSFEGPILEAMRIAYELHDQNSALLVRIIEDSRCLL